MKKVLLFSLVFSVLVLGGCVQPQQQSSGTAEKAASAPQPTEPKETAKPAVPAPAQPAEPAKPTPPPPPAKPARELVQNGDFGQADDDGVPAYWTMSKGELISSPSGAKAVALQVMDNPEEWNILQQKILNVKPGSKLHVAATIQADNPEMAVVKVVWWEKEGEKSKQKLQTETKKMAPVEFDVTLPEAASGVVSVQILRVPKTQGELLVQKVSVTTTD